MLEDRIQSLEEQARFTLDVLEMAASLGDFQTSINKLSQPHEIIKETRTRVNGFISFLGSSFYLVEEGSSDFYQMDCEPDRFTELIRSEITHLIDTGIFALAVRENRPITVYSRDKRYRLVLHVLSTSARIRGMFVGLLARTDRNISAIVLSLLSIILKNCANAIESFELYRLFRQNETRYREFATFLPQAVLATDETGKLTHLADAAASLLSCTTACLADYTHLTDLVAPAERESLARTLTTLTPGDPPLTLSISLAPRSPDTPPRPALLYLRRQSQTELRGTLLAMD